MALSDYITDVRRLLHDANGNYYSDEDLTSDINKARARVVRDTGCLRTLQSFTFNPSQEAYQFVDLPNGQKTLDVLNINILWGNMRYPLQYFAWTDFNARLRQLQTFVSQPTAFSIYGQNTIYIGPMPDMTYQCEVDTVILPDDLVDDLSVEQIMEPYTDPIPYYAAYTAKYQEQSFGEAQAYEDQYKQKVLSVLRSVMTRRIPTPYSSWGGGV